MWPLPWMAMYYLFAASSSQHSFDDDCNKRFLFKMASLVWLVRHDKKMMGQPYSSNSEIVVIAVC
jgi:hypothetical protein